MNDPFVPAKAGTQTKELDARVRGHERRKFQGDSLPKILAGLADRLVQAVAVVCMLALIFCVVAGVVSRQMNAPLAWTDEMAQMFLVWSAIAGWMIALRRRSHIRITMLIDRLPPRARALAEIVIQLGVIVFGLLLLRYGFGLIERTWDVEAISLPISSAIIYVPLPALAIALILQGLAQLIEAAQGRVGPSTVEPEVTGT
jgi:TRAP-type C4-dicarboxylate transport system permease small subunit